MEGSTLVTGMAINCRSFGIRISGLGDQWFTGAHPQLDGKFFDDHSRSVGGQVDLRAQTRLARLHDPESGELETPTETVRYLAVPVRLTGPDPRGVFVVAASLDTERDEVMDRSLTERNLLDTMRSEVPLPEGEGTARTYPPPPALLDLDSLAAEVEGNSERPPPIRRIGGFEPVHLKPARLPTQLFDTLVSVSPASGGTNDDEPADES